jgi:hypothetical protein
MVCSNIVAARRVEMKVKHAVVTLLGILVVLAAVCLVSIVTRRLDADAGVIRFPIYQGTETMDTARDMIYDLGWEHLSEASTNSGKTITFKAKDAHGSVVTFDFVYGLVTTHLAVSTEENPQHTKKQISRELARRIGLHVEGAPLPEVANAQATGV